ncbi:MAG: YajG family lipoprotein [Candidatus Binatus sp.]|uniref:YajG family lipoprotein n=1 Tax=Candidatus Binatus sp. TaxID=2811406 RepID=UPI003C72ED68
MRVFTVSAICRLLTGAATILIVGCAPLDVSMRYLPQTDVQPVPGAESVRVAVQVDDLRSNTADIGTLANPLRTREITTNDNVAQAVRDAVQIELRDRGFKIGADSAALVIHVNGLDVERRIGWVYKNNTHAMLMMQVEVMRKDGKVIYAHEAVGERGDTYIDADHSVGSAERVMNLAVEDCIQRLFADPKFIDALLKASKP